MSDNSKLTIAVAASARAAKWKNKHTTWAEISAKLCETERTEETIKQYLSYPKDKQGEIKDVGGFVGGRLLPGTGKIKGKDVTFKEPFGWRRVGYVDYRQIVALDVDFGNIDVWLDFTLLEKAGMFYTTHKHTPESPRLRIVFPLDRPVSPDEYECIARVVASWLDIDVFDDTTYQPTRLMYYPSTSKNGEFLSNISQGPFICADDVLAELDDWTDVTTWPASSRETKVKRSATDKVEDPEEKTGIVGAFCRVHTIDDAIAIFLPEVYAPCEAMGPDRYSYLLGTTAGGLIVYDGKLAFSHHNTDPAGGRLSNAFDLVRLHKFGMLDEKAKDEEDVSKLPSYKAMSVFAASLTDVKKELVRERREASAGDYDDEEAKAVKAAEADDWVEELETEGKAGKFKSSIHNIVLIFKHDPSFAGKFGYNEFQKREVVLSALPWDKKRVKYPRPIVDSDDAEIRHYLERAYDISGEKRIIDALTITVMSNSYHPVREYLDGLEWDGVERLDSLFITLFGADDTEYTRAVTRKAFAAAVARIYSPGIKFDYMVLLLGEQGTGKSSVINCMGGEWHTDSVTNVTGTAALEGLQGAWLVELAELAGLRRAEVEAVKQFVSKREDRFRVAYGRRLDYFPRSCVFFGTSNEDDPLRDATGNRRFWVVDCKAREGSVKWYDYFEDEETRNQLWAEAKARREEGERLYLDEELEAEARDIQDAHLEKDERAGLIDEYLKRKLPKNWETMEPFSRRMWLKEDENAGTVERTHVCVLEIWTECLGKNPEDITRKDSMEVGRVMKTMRDWAQTSAARVKFYGVQKLFERKS